MTNVTVTVLTSKQIKTRWPSNDDCLINHLVKTAVERNYKIGIIECKPFFYPDTDLRTFCLLSLEGYYHRMVHFNYIIDTSEMLDNKLYVAFS